METETLNGALESFEPLLRRKEAFHCDTNFVFLVTESS